MRLMLPACIVLAFSSGCLDIVLGLESVRGSGRVTEERHRFAGLTGVELATRGELEIRLGDNEGLQVSADDNLHEHLALTTNGGTLRIGTRHGVNLRPSRPIRYTLTASEIEFIELSSSGNARAPTLHADRVEIRLASSGDLSVDGIQADAVDISVDSSGDLSVDSVQADAVDLRMRSSGDVQMDDLRTGSLTVGVSSSGDVRIREGDVDSLDIALNSSGDYDGESVRATRASVTLNSAGDARLWAEESLQATLNSSGSVSYRGNPEVRERRTSTGRVRPIR
jgi:hypothetical protein